MIANILGGSHRPAALERIIGHAEGNPLFLEQTVAMLVDDGLLQKTDEGWELQGDLSIVRVPPTITGLLEARLDRLSSEERAVIGRASVEGRVFHWGSVTALSSDLPSGRSLATPAIPRPARPDRTGGGHLRRERSVPLPTRTDPGRGLRGDAQRGASRPPRALRGLARSAWPVSTPWSSTRCSPTTSSRRTGSARSSVRWTSTAASWPTRPPSGSRRAVVVREIEGTSLPRPTCSRVRWRCSIPMIRTAPTSSVRFGNITPRSRRPRASVRRAR